MFILLTNFTHKYRTLMLNSVNYSNEEYSEIHEKRLKDFKVSFCLFNDTHEDKNIIIRNW